MIKLLLNYPLFAAAITSSSKELFTTLDYLHVKTVSYLENVSDIEANFMTEGVQKGVL